MQQRSDLQEERLLAGDIPDVCSWIRTPDNFDGVLNTILNGSHTRKNTRSEIGNYMNFYEEVYQSLVNHARNPVPASDGILTMKIIDAALQSSKEQRVIKLEQ